MKKVIFLIIAFILFFLVSIYMGWLGKARHVENVQSLPLAQEIISERSKIQTNAAKKAVENDEFERTEEIVKLKYRKAAASKTSLSEGPRLAWPSFAEV